MSASRRGSFFPLRLSRLVALRVALVGGQFAPAVAVQQLVDRGQRHGAPQLGFEFHLDLADHEDATVAGAIQERRQRLALLLDRHVLAAAPATRGALPVADNLPGQESVAQPAGPGHRAAYGPRRFFQAQPVVQRQHHRLGLPQLLHRLRLRHNFPCPLQVVCPSCPSRHVCPFLNTNMTIIYLMK